MRAGVAIILTIFLVSCDAFRTREPEAPTSGNNNFVPPTSPDIVISNFETALEDLNAENYAACFAGPDEGYQNEYFFEPTAEALSLYAALFVDWDVENERGYLLNLSSDFAESEKMTYVTSDARFESQTTDSAVFSADYLIELDKIETFRRNYVGSMRLTISRNEAGLWAITRWIDFTEISDTAAYSWSFLKAEKGN